MFKIQRLTGIFAGNVKDALRDASKTANKQPALRAKNWPPAGRFFFDRDRSRMTLKANWTSNEVRCVDLLGDEQEQCPWPSKCESFIAAPMAIVGISPATSI
jgi:hypothetical protein